MASDKRTTPKKHEKIAPTATQTNHDMISQTCEYALRSIVFLAEHADQPQTIREVASATGVPSEYLAKVLANLKRAGIAQAKRGLHGGYTLAVAPERLTILDVINAVDPIQRIRQCPIGRSDHVGLCPLHRRLDEALARIEQSFAATTVAEILEENAASRRVRSTGSKACPFPAVRSRTSVSTVRVRRGATNDKIEKSTAKKSKKKKTKKRRAKSAE